LGIGLTVGVLVAAVCFFVVLALGSAFVLNAVAALFGHGRESRSHA
jgi:hypothetical protein